MNFTVVTMEFYGCINENINFGSGENLIFKQQKKLLVFY